MSDPPPTQLHHRLPPAFVRLVARHYHMPIGDRNATRLLQLFLNLADTSDDRLKGRETVLELLSRPAPVAEVTVADVNSDVLWNILKIMICL